MDIDDNNSKNNSTNTFNLTCTYIFSYINLKLTEVAHNSG